MNDYKDLSEMLRDMSRAIIRDDAEQLGVAEEMITDIDADACMDAADAIEQLVRERDAAVEAAENIHSDFADFACTGMNNLAPYCGNRCPECIDESGWCKDVTKFCKGFISVEYTEWRGVRDADS